MTCKCLGLLAALVTTAAVSLIVLQKTIVNDPIWRENILAKCNFETNDDYLSSGVEGMFKVGLGFGAYFGLIYHAKMCPGMLLSQSTLNKKWYAMPLLRLLIGVSSYLIVNLINDWIWSDKFSNIYLKDIVTVFLPQFLCTFILFGTNDHFCTKLGLIKTSDDS